MIRGIWCGLLAGIAACAGPAQAAARCDDDPRVAAVARAWRAGEPLPPLEISMAQANCFRDALLRAIRPSLGPVVGYKVGVYTQAARAPLKATGPAVGILRQGMMLPVGRPVSVRIAYAPVAEPDFLVVIGDARINTARTREEAYRSVRGIRAFIELPDNHYPADVAPDLARLIALDVNARAGVAGPEVRLPQTPAGFAALASLAAQATIRTAAGEDTQTGIARETLGDPIEIVLAARDLLLAQGIRLKAGDVISLGSLLLPKSPQAGETLHVRYTLGTLSAEIEVTFSG